MGRYVGNDGLSRLWTKYKQKYILKNNALSVIDPNQTYTYSESSESAVNIAVNIITSHVGNKDTLQCTLSQPVDINLLFKISLNSTYRRYFTILAGHSSVIFNETGVTGNGSLQNISGVSVVNASLIASKYTFTITRTTGTTLYEHTLSLEDATVDWHAMTVSGILTRTTSASQPPGITTNFGLSYWDRGTVTFYRTVADSTLYSNENTTTVNAVSLVPSNTSYYGAVTPINAQFSYSQTSHYITCLSKTYTSLIADVGITVSLWSQTNLQPEAHWYRWSGACVYRGTKPCAVCSVTGLVTGDELRIDFYAYFGSWNNIPYTRFSKTVSWGGGSTLSFDFDPVDNYYSGISDGFTDTCYLFMDAYLTNTSKGMNSQYIGSWPSSTSDGLTGSTFTRTFTKPTTSSRPKLTNGTLFGRVTLKNTAV